MTKDEEACVILLRIILTNLEREGYITINELGEYANIFLRGREDHLMPISVPLKTYASIKLKIQEAERTLWEIEK